MLSCVVLGSQSVVSPSVVCQSVSQSATCDAILPGLHDEHEEDRDVDDKGGGHGQAADVVVQG